MSTTFERVARPALTLSTQDQVGGFEGSLLVTALKLSRPPEVHAATRTGYYTFKCNKSAAAGNR